MMDTTAGRPVRLVDPHQLASSERDIRGKVIRDCRSKAFGRVEHLYVDPASKKIQFLHIDVDKDVVEFDQKLFIPIETVTEINEDSVWITAPLAHLARAPFYDARRLDDDGYWWELYDYYGLSPYQTPSHATTPPRPMRR